MSKPTLAKSSYTKNVGYFYPINRKKYMGDSSAVVYRSGLEKSFMSWCDRTDNVIKWSSEEIWVPYYYDMKNRRYFVDFFIRVRNSKGDIEDFLIEVKMSKELYLPKKPKKGVTKYYKEQLYQYHMNKAKWQSAKKFAEQKNMRFMILTEKTINKRK